MWLQDLLRRAADAFRNAETPFDDYLEMPPIVIPLSRRHSRALKEAAEQARVAERALLLDILELLWGLDASARVSDEDLRRHGFEPAAPGARPSRLLVSAGLRVRVHRGAREIGGSCVEIESAGHRLVLDLGLPLQGDADLPAVPGLGASPDPSFLGVVLTHAHPDHYGLVARAPGVPLYMGAATEQILAEAAFFTRGGLMAPVAAHLREGERLQLGPFAVTPLLIDHSAFDAYALLVEAGGRRLLYSGDLRAHGRKPGAFAGLLRTAGVDVLLLEGTHVRDGPPPRSVLTSEQEVEERAVEVFREMPGMALALYSPQNVDRMVTLFRAAKRSGRLFVQDLYAASIAKATGRPTIPQPDWPEVRVYVPRSQAAKVARAGAFPRTEAVKAQRIYRERLAGMASRLVMTFRHRWVKSSRRRAASSAPARSGGVQSPV